MKNFAPRAALLLLLATLLAACSTGASAPGPTPTTAQPTAAPAQTPGTPGETPPQEGTAMVESIELLMLESFPVQVHALVQGNMPDACTTVGSVTQERDGNTFTVKIATTRPQDMMCAQVITPFEETIALDVAGLDAGTYTVDVNGVTETFTLDVDNRQP